MKKLNQHGLTHFLALFLIIVVLGIVGFVGWRVWDMDAGGEDSVSIAEAGDFKREGVVTLPRIGLHNMEVIELPNGNFRAYFHEGPSGTQSAISKDGKTFTIEAGTRIRGSVPATVRLDDGRWRTYYSSSEGLLSAVSADGLSYTEEPGVRIPKGNSGDLDAFGITHPSIVKLPDGSYRMYYDGQFKQESGPYWRIMSASSKDGLTWVKDKGSRIPVDTDFGDFEAELAFSCYVHYKNGQYVMYFSSQGNPISASGIWRAVSDDGIDFKVENTPVLARDSEFGNDQDSQSVGGPKGVPQDPFILNVKGGERLFYWTSDKGYQSAFRAND